MPHTYTRQNCERCAGTGRIKRPPGRAHYVFAHDSRRRPSCPECIGRGFNEVRVRIEPARIEGPTNE